MISISRVKWLGKMAFDAQQNGHSITIDAKKESGGEDRGTSPKVLLLTGLAGCTGMDVVSILRKMKVEDYGLEIEVTGELTEEHPKIYHTIVVNYYFEGSNLPEAKLRKAVDLSEEKYCGVSAMLRKAADIQNRIYINGEELK